MAESSPAAPGGKLLTIAIPSYNRPAEIVKRVGELLPQLSPGVELVILDNQSPSPIGELVGQAYPESVGKVVHLRNPVNIGGNANICRCFEVGSAPWMWLLGDDDVVKPGAVEGILAEISKCQGDDLIAGFTCSSGIYTYAREEVFPDPSSFAEGLSDLFRFSNALFISAQVYRVDVIRPHLRHAYQAISSCGAQLVCVFKALEKGYRWKVVPLSNVEHAQPDAEEHWNPITVSAGLPLLLEAVEKPGLLGKGFRKGLRSHLSDLSLKGSVRNILFDTNRDALFWEIYYLRTASLGMGSAYLKSMGCALFARFVHTLPSAASVVRKIVRAIHPVPPAISSQEDRL